MEGTRTLHYIYLLILELLTHLVNPPTNCLKTLQTCSRNQKINQRGYLPNKGWKPTRAIWCANYKTNRKSYDDAYLRHIYIINILEQVYLIMHYIYMIQQTPCWLTLHRLKGITKNYSMNPTSLIVLQWLLLWTNIKSLFLDYPLNYVFIFEVNLTTY